MMELVGSSCLGMYLVLEGTTMVSAQLQFVRDYSTVLNMKCSCMI
jgi:hypothetical protein